MISDKQQTANARLSMDARLSLARMAGQSKEDEARYCLEISKCVATIIILETT